MVALPLLLFSCVAGGALPVTSNRFSALHCRRTALSHFARLCVMNSARGTFPRAWLLPVFADHIKNTELAFFTETMLPLANRMAAKAEELQAVGQVSAVRSGSSRFVPGHCVGS